MEVVMRELFVGLALAAMSAIVLPAVAQNDATENNPTEEQYAPGTGGTSKPGVEGLPGNKSGPATDQSGASEGAGSEQSGANPDDAAGSDNSKVPGLPGNKSGPAEENPD